MTPERWQQVKAALAEALALTGEQRAAFLARMGETDPPLRSEVESLLAVDEVTNAGFMSSPVPAMIGFGDSPGRFMGRRLGPYEILAQIGAGGMGEVYRAARVDEEYRQHVAIKLVRAGQEASFIAQRLRAERQILASFAHPNIARLLDGGTTEEGIPYLVMELIDGQPITQYCDENRLDTNARLRLFIQVCSAVQYAHQHMVIHRDLKPSNILVTRDGVPKLLDFGIAKIVDPGAMGVQPNLTLNAFAVLTPQYASPEQFTGGTITAVSDVYSLGVILYELLTGSPPYLFAQPGNPPEVARTVLTYEPRRPSAVVRPPTGRRSSDGASQDGISSARDESSERLSRRLRGDLDNIVLMALRKEPQRRYAGAEQFAEDIRRHLQHMPVIARQDTLGYRASTFVRRHTVGVVAASLIMVVLVIGIVMTTREARIAEVQRERAERRFSDLRKIASALIFDIHDSIRDLPGASKSRHLLIDTSLHYLDGLSREAPGDPGLQRDLAAAYQRLGDLQGRVFEANEGDYPGAQKSYRSSLALLQAALQQDPTNIDVRREVVVACGKLSDLSWNMGDAAGALEYSRLTLTHSQVLAETHRDNLKLQGLRATAQLDYGYKLFHLKGDATQALNYMQPAVKLMESLSAADPGNQRLVRAMALGYGRVSEALGSDPQRLSEALTMEIRQKQVLDALVAASPDNSDLAHLHAFSEHDEAATLEQMGRLQEAADLAQNALVAFRSLSAAEPKVDEYHMDIALALNDLAKISLDRGDPQGALPQLQEALQQTDHLATDGDAQARVVRADTQSLLGDAGKALAADPRRSETQRRRDHEEACQHLKEAFAVYLAFSGRFAEASQQARQQAGKVAECH